MTALEPVGSSTGRTDSRDVLAPVVDALVARGCTVQRRPDGLLLTEGEPASLLDVAAALHTPALEAPRLLDLWGEESQEGWSARLLVGCGDRFLLHRARLDTGLELPDIGALQPAAHWLARDMMGRTPLRVAGWDPAVGVPEAPPQPLGATQGRGVFTIPFGPVRSGVVEAMLYDVATAGEDMLQVVPRTGFKRRGLERRLCEVPLDQVQLVAERIAGVYSVAAALAVCQAVENAAAVELDPRAEAIRAVLAELERIHNHCDSIMKLSDDASLGVGTAQMGILKERILRLLAALTGHRYGRGIVLPGGVTRALSDVALVEELRSFERDGQRVQHLLLTTDSFLDRLQATGRITLADTAALGASGPVARGSQLAWDARAERPYGAYRENRVSAAVMADCDAMARTEVRMAEIRTSLSFIVDATRAHDLTRPGTLAPPRPEPGAVGIGWVEAPEGEWLAVVEMGADGRLARARLRPASLLNFGCFQRACEGWVLTDFAFIEHSFGLSVAGRDR